ncbi:MAG: dockerin type I domain-containing protein [Planctomycetota bacterium]
MNLPNSLFTSSTNRNVRCALGIGIASLVLIASQLPAQIARERPGGVAERVFLHYDDPDVALRSYATVDTGGCSGTMIGPNVLLSAAHCSAADRNVTFRVYTGSTVQATERFFARYLTHSFPDTDLVLYYVQPNSRGENPGDKYGYLDFDVVYDMNGRVARPASAGLHARGSEVYAVWTNPITSIGGGWHMIYSRGDVTSILRPGWFSPGVDGERCPTNLLPTLNLAVHSDVWSRGGASGSSSMSTETHRLLLGPLSTGVQDAPGRQQLSIVDYLTWGYADPSTGQSCDPTVRRTVNEDFVRSLGVDPADYYQLMDKDRDGIFDIQHDVERERGEMRKDWYWLGFESARRNAMWDVWQPQALRFDTSNSEVGLARIDTRSLNGTREILSHSGLRLLRNREYNLSLLAALYDGPSNAFVRFRLVENGRSRTILQANLPRGRWVLPAANFRTTAAAPTLHIDVSGQSNLSLATISIIERDATMNFDTHDKRYMWRNHNTGGRGTIWPNGRTAVATPNWCGVARVDPAATRGDDWSLRNRHFALVAGKTYRLTFVHKRAVRDPLTSGSRGVLRVTDWSGEITRHEFTPGNNWSSGATPEFTVPTSSNNVEIGVIARDSRARGSYLIDDIRVITVERTRFQRGDANQDRNIDLSDALTILSNLFLGGAHPACRDAADVDDDGIVNISDPIILLRTLFDNADVFDPLAGCVEDRTEDSLSCDSSRCDS